MGRGSVCDSKVNVITGYLNAQHAELVDLIIELLADPREWQGEGVWTMQQWLAWRCGVSASTAQQLVDVALRADDLPVSVQAFRDAELSLDQITSIARRAPWWVDEQICNLAKMMTVSQISRTLRKYPFPNLDTDGREIRIIEPAAIAEVEAASIHEHKTSTDDSPNAAPDVAPAATLTGMTTDEWCSFVFGEDGVFRLHLATDFETGQIIQTAMTEARDQLFQNGQVDVDWVDAVREVAQRSLDTVADPARRARFKINLHIDTESHSMTDAGGWSVPDAIRRHLTCDGLLSPVFVANGKPVSVGRTQRIVPDRTRTVVELRDGHRCRVPGCTAANWLEVHHIVHWEHDGPTDTWNLVQICAHHRRRHHRGHLGITGDADLPDGTPGSLEFTDGSGRRIQPSGAAPTQPNGPPPEPAGVYEHPLGERIRPGSLYFRPPPAHQAELNERIAHDRKFFNDHPDLGW